MLGPGAVGASRKASKTCAGLPIVAVPGDIYPPRISSFIPLEEDGAPSPNLWRAQ